MSNSTIICDRCGKIIESGDKDPFLYGFCFDMVDGKFSQYARWEEKVVCFPCINDDKSIPRYALTGSL